VRGSHRDRPQRKFKAAVRVIILRVQLLVQLDQILLAGKISHSCFYIHIQYITPEMTSASKIHEMASGPRESRRNSSSSLGPIDDFRRYQVFQIHNGYPEINPMREDQLSQLRNGEIPVAEFTLVYILHFISSADRPLTAA